VLGVAAILVSVYYAYSLLLNYKINKPAVELGKSIQELVPSDGYLFYVQAADITNPEHLYYAWRRGILANIDATNNALVSQVVRDHRWTPDSTYLLTNAIRLAPGQQDKLRARLDKYELREVRTAFDKGICLQAHPEGLSRPADSFRAVPKRTRSRCSLWLDAQALPGPVGRARAPPMDGLDNARNGRETSEIGHDWLHRNECFRGFRDGAACAGQAKGDRVLRRTRRRGRL
jgi:hypothetical protein